MSSVDGRTVKANVRIKNRGPKGAKPLLHHVPPPHPASLSAHKRRSLSKRSLAWTGTSKRNALKALRR